MKQISLTASMRSNLLSLQNISRQVSLVQNRLSTGNKVNSAIDNPNAFYIARSLTNRANDLSALLDSMGQAVSTIKAATTALETGANLLEQAAAYASQTLVEGVLVKTLEDWIEEGYTAVSTQGQLEAALDAGDTKLILTADIELTSGITITQSDIFIEGNGRKISFSGTNDSTIEAAIKVDGGKGIDIKNLYIEVSGKNTFGIQSINGATVTIDNTNGISAKNDAKKITTSTIPALYDGKSNTEVVRDIDEDFSNYEAFLAATSHEVKDSGGNIIDCGNWYLGSIGELQQVQKNYKNINTALTNAGGSALATGYYWSSTESSDTHVWVLYPSINERSAYYKDNNSYYVRSFQLIEGAYNPLEHPEQTQPKVSDIVYKNASGDLIWASRHTTTAPSGYTAIGVITDVSATGDVTIMSLNDLPDPIEPSGATDTTMTWRPRPSTIENLTNYGTNTVKTALASGGTITSSNQAFTASADVDVGDIENGNDVRSRSKKYQDIIAQYNALINDSSYKGVNLLKNDSLSVTFNESRSSSLELKGEDLSSANLGLKTLSWRDFEAVKESIKELTAAVNQIRNMSAELGNSYALITTRQAFTENLINVLTEGSNKLTLADMNEESAYMLALQTRQQLAINSLSLASKASQGILRLF